MKRTSPLSLLLSFLVIACGTEPSGNVSGSWDFSEALTSGSGITCDLPGDLLVSQASNGPRFTGQHARQGGTCTGAPAGYDPNGVYGLIDGDLNGSTVTFEIDFCRYEGDLSEPNMSGTVRCDDGLSGLPNVVFTGTWQATRASP